MHPPFDPAKQPMAAAAAVAEIATDKKAASPAVAPSVSPAKEKSPAEAVKPSNEMLASKDPDDLPKTTGEWYYDGLQFTLGKASIMVFTAALGYLARYGKDHYGPVPNVFKLF